MSEAQPPASEPEARALTMAELKASLEDEREVVAQGGEPVESPTRARPRERDDELLDVLPETDHHLGRFAGWRATRRSRLIVGVGLSVAGLVAVIAFFVHTRELRHARLHPLPELEATIAPGTSREMTLSEGHMRVQLAREAPSINVLHLPDRDITLAPRVDKVQFKVEVREGQTVRLKILTGDADDLRETLTAPGAKPLLPSG